MVAILAGFHALNYYTTNFDLSETPISESSKWTQPSSGNVQVNTSSGLAFGTQTGTGGFNDSIALLTGASSFPPNQYASAVVHRSASFSPSTTREVEILLRASAPGGVATWYECNYAWDGAYLQIIYIANGTFAYLVGNGSGGNPGPAGGIQDGDVVSAQIVGNTITSMVNGTVYGTYVDKGGANGTPLILSGSPGIGFWRGGVTTGTDQNNDYCFTSFTARNL